LFMGKPYLGPPVDLWSLGVLIYVMIAGALPFKDSQHILSLHFTFPPNFPPGPKDLITKLLVFEPEERLTIKDVLAHPWICGNLNTPLPPVVPNTVVDEEILLKIEEMGFSSFTVRSSLQANEFNQFTTTYFLLQKKKERSNVGPEGKELKSAVGLNSSSTSSVETSSDTDSEERNSNSSGSSAHPVRVNKGKKKKKEECYLI
jgi:serine/threonine protein kinase